MASLSRSEVVEVLVKLFKKMHLLNINNFIGSTITQKQQKINKSRQKIKKVLKSKQKVLTRIEEGIIIVTKSIEIKTFEGVRQMKNYS